MLCVVDDDLANLEIALVAREMRPDVRVVTQLGNQAIGRAMSDGNGPGAVLDVAGLAAPAIVEACLSRRIHEVPVGAETFLVATLPVECRVHACVGCTATWCRSRWSGRQTPMAATRWWWTARAGTSRSNRGTSPPCSARPRTSRATGSTSSR